VAMATVGCDNRAHDGRRSRSGGRAAMRRFAARMTSGVRCLEARRVGRIP
jgi:hypothetical protein